ncbi:MAG: hypothetical protein K2Q23_03910 [Bryobacteraceae bacterium]|nr:hypothetical protein [Bryobacteraceae bacterium]
MSQRKNNRPSVPDAPDFGDFISGGYFLVKPLESHSFPLMPEPLVSVSSCITEVGPSGFWTPEWHRRTREFSNPIDAQVAATVLPEGVRMAKQDAPFGFCSFVSASAYYAHFTPPTILVGIGLHKSLTRLIEVQRSRDIGYGIGLVQRMARRRRLRAGRVLGYEPLGFEGMKFHSWVCNWFPESVGKDLGIRPAANGFLSSFADARRVNQYIRRGRAEPAIWLPWLVVQYGSEGAEETLPNGHDQ